MPRLNFQKQKPFISKPLIMGILNVTPDSFFDGGRHDQIDLALSHCQTMIEEGADIIDIGGFSTRPNGVLVSEEEELTRVLPIIKHIREHFPEIPISVDTYRASVAKQCMEADSDLINDISGGTFDPEMIPFIGQNHIPYVLMHLLGTPETMHQFAITENVHETVMQFFKRQCGLLLQYGEQQIILDPGIGFSKSLEANYQLLNNLDKYRFNQYPILIGISRKSLINKVLQTDPAHALNGTTVLNTIALMNGADILRVHDVKQAKEAVLLVEKYKTCIE